MHRLTRIQEPLYTLSFSLQLQLVLNNHLEKTIMEKEAKRIIPLLKGYVIAFAIEGKKQSSQGLAKLMSGLIDKGNGVITFVIGGSYGLSDVIKGKANELMSFSDMTFPHTLFRLMAVEQIYRAFKIIKKETYHK